MSTGRFQIVARLQSLVALAVMVIAMHFLSDRFFTTENGLNILRQISVNLCLSIGMTLVILTAGIDLSVGSVLAFSGVVMAGLLKHGIAIPRTDWLIQFNPSGAIIAAVLVGAALGWINGTVITRLGVPPFVATLGMLSMARGLTRIWTGGHEIPLDSKLATIGNGVLWNVPIPVWIVAALVVVAFVLTRMTRFGRYVYAIGGNERAALLSGLPVARVKRTVYVLCGALAGVAAVILCSRLNAGVPIAGFGYELDSIAAVVIGGTSLSGGRGSVFGTVIGCLIIGVLNYGLGLLNVEQGWQDVIKGVVIIAAVAVDRQNTRGGQS
jgi:ribose transport system permease protein